MQRIESAILTYVFDGLVLDSGQGSLRSCRVEPKGDVTVPKIADVSYNSAQKDNIESSTRSALDHFGDSPEAMPSEYRDTSQPTSRVTGSNPSQSGIDANVCD